MTEKNHSIKKTVSKDLLDVQPNKLEKSLVVNRNCKTNGSFSAPQTFRMPQSALLNRVRNFIPEISTANDKLLHISSDEKEKLDIENVDENEKVIEMDIALVDDELLVSENESDNSSDSEESDDESIESNNNTKKNIIEEIRTTTNS